jgi:hypothetical protein
MHLRDLGYQTAIGKFSDGEQYVRVFSKETNLRNRSGAYEQLGLVMIRNGTKVPHWYVEHDSDDELHAVMAEV